MKEDLFFKESGIKRKGFSFRLVDLQMKIQFKFFKLTVWFGLGFYFLFYGISTIVGYLMPNPFLYIYIKDILYS